MRSVKVTVEILGTQLKESTEFEIHSMKLDQAVRAGAERSINAASEIMEDGICAGLNRVGRHLARPLADRLAVWVRDVEQKVEDRPEET